MSGIENNPNTLRETCAESWTDHNGRVWNTRMTAGRLHYSKYKSAAALRDFTFERGKHKCRYCSATENLVMDHIYPAKKGGSNHPDNTQVLCSRCNTIKSDMVPERWRSYCALRYQSALAKLEKACSEVAVFGSLILREHAKTPEQWVASEAEE